MFVRRLVRGVRSSCEASCTSCLWRCEASSSEASIALNVEASVPISSVPSISIRWLRSRVARTRSAVSLNSRSGRSVARATNRPGPVAIAMPPIATRNSQRRMRASSLSTLESCSITWIATGGANDDGIVKTLVFTPPRRVS